MFYILKSSARLIQKTAFILLTWTGVESVVAQEADSIRNADIIFSAALEHGKILPTNFYLSELETPKQYTGYHVSARYQTDGSREWEQVFGNPSFGLGVFAADLHADRDIARPLAVYGTFNTTARSWEKLKWDYWVSFGIAIGGNPYHMEMNPNPTLGTKTNMYIGVGSAFKYKLAHMFDLGLGLSFNHLSNGAMKTPNKGLNVVAPQLSLTYHPEGFAPVHKISSRNLPFEKSDKIELSGFYGRKNVFYRGVNREFLADPYDGFNFTITGMEGLYMRKFSYKSSAGFGVGITYDDSYNYDLFVDGPVVNKRKRFENARLLLSVLPSYRLSVNNLHVNVQAGYYPFKKTRQYDEFRFFQRVGIQYEFNNRMFASFGINAFDFHRANYLEWRLGYVISKKIRH